MLVLTRRLGEEVLIAGHIRLKVVAAKGNQVRLGITAPPAVPVARLELLAGCPEDAGTPAMSCAALPAHAKRRNRPR
jgi:carbon storage regulator